MWIVKKNITFFLYITNLIYVINKSAKITKIKSEIHLKTKHAT